MKKEETPSSAPKWSAGWRTPALEKEVKRSRDWGTTGVERPRKRVSQ